MISNYRDFLNEAARSKFPSYKVGDFVLTNGWVEFGWKSNLTSSWDTYTRYIADSVAGALCKIVEVNLEKKEYVLEFAGGILRSEYIRNSRGRSYSSEIGFDPSRKIYLRLKKESEVTTEGLAEAQKILQSLEYKPGDEVSVKISNEKTVTRKLIGVAIKASLESGKISYLISSIIGSVESSRIEKEVNLDSEEARNVLAEEIAKVLGTKIIEKTNSEFIYDIAKVEGKELITGVLYFNGDAAREKFQSDLQKFIDSKLDENLQKIMYKGESSQVKVKEVSSTMGRWYKADIPVNKIIQAARNIGINIKEFLEKKRGKITGDKYGL